MRNKLKKYPVSLPRNPAPAPKANDLRPPPPNNVLGREPPRILVPPPYLKIRNKSMLMLYTTHTVIRIKNLI